MKVEDPSGGNLSRFYHLTPQLSWESGADSLTPCTSPSDNLDPAADVAAAAEKAVTSGGLELQQQQQTVSFSKITSKQKAKMQCQIDFQMKPILWI